MVSSTQVDPLTIRDIDFTVARQIEQCPKTMMLRELTMNALEAAGKAPEGSRKVIFKAKRLAETGDANKLAIWNSGPGMSSEDLDHICDLAASLGKEMALEGNFGMGAKVASLPSNNLGMRYRSCRDGVVSQVVLGKREGVYGKLLVQFDDGTRASVVDVTEQVEAEAEYALDQGWTEVVLLGQRKDQDTVRDPYDGDPEQDRQWIATGLYHRFYHVPEGVEVAFEEVTHKLDGNRPFEPIPLRLPRFGRSETVEIDGGYKLHYFYDPAYKTTGHNASISGSVTTSVSTAAIVYRGEMYDVRTGRKWAADAPAFGIPFGARHISVHVELPDTFPARHEAYRRFIQLAQGDQRQLVVEDFAGLVFEHRPDWLVEIINSLAPQSSGSTDDLRKELQDLLNELRVKSHGPRLAPDGINLVEHGGARGAAPTTGSANAETKVEKSAEPTDLVFNQTGAKKANITKNAERAPDIIILRTEEEAEEKDIGGKAARYVSETNTLFVNLSYPAVTDAQEHLELRYATYEDPEIMREQVRLAAERLIMGRVGFAVVFAQAKQLRREWTPDDVKAALRPESLSIAADGWRDAVSNIYRTLTRKFGVAKSDLEEAA